MRYTIFTIISAFILLASCTPQESKDIFDIPQEGYTLFETDFEDLTIAGTTAEMIWEKGIGVYGSSKGSNERYILKKAYDGKAVGEFYGPEVSGESISAYYPYSEDYALFGDKMMYSLSDAQTFDGHTDILTQFTKYAGYAYAFRERGNKLNFRYASGVMSVQVRLSNVETVTSVVLTSDSPLSGTGFLDSDMKVTLGSSASKSIRLDCGEGIVSKNGDDYIDFPLVMPAGVYPAVSVVVNRKDGQEVVKKLGTVEIERITFSSQNVTEVVVATEGLGGFDIEGGLDFEPQS